jgi:hypothetical protein
MGQIADELAQSVIKDVVRPAYPKAQRSSLSAIPCKVLQSLASLQLWFLSPNPQGLEAVECIVSSRGNFPDSGADRSGTRVIS